MLESSRESLQPERIAGHLIACPVQAQSPAQLLNVSLNNLVLQCEAHPCLAVAPYPEHFVLGSPQMRVADRKKGLLQRTVSFSSPGVSRAQERQLTLVVVHSGQTLDTILVVAKANAHGRPQN